MHSPAYRVLVTATLVLAVALAGCTGTDGGGEAQLANPDDEENGSGRVYARSSFDVFTVTALNVTSTGLPGENATTIHEDSNVTVAFTVKNTGKTSSSGFVTLLVDGTVTFTESVYLAPGESEDFARAFTSGATGTLTVQVRTGNHTAERTVNVEPRARVGDAQETPILHAEVTRVFADRPGHSTVNVTVTNPVDENATHAPMKVAFRLVCTPTTGDEDPFPHAWFEFTAPEPGESRTGDVPLARCPDGSTTLAVQALVWDRAGGDPAVLTWMT